MTRLIFFLAIWLATTFPAIAQADAYCFEQERLAPNGKVVELGGRNFRICDNQYQIGIKPEVEFFLSVPFDSSHVQRVLQQNKEIEFLWGRLMVRDWDFDYPIYKSYISTTAYIGDIHLAGGRYKIYDTKAQSDETVQLFKKGLFGLQDPFLIYVPDGEKMRPHTLSCSGDIKGTPRGKYHCHFNILFDEESRLIAHTRLIWNPEFSLDNPLNFDNLHIFLNALVAVFEGMEVSKAD
ncbi:MAG: hypothetical protein ABJM82_15450 [Shimia thalassica]|uniref:hypothetical protein n=1 Tax=Shimia thalassica TaxID=1715693 RepID=UPI003298FB1A